MGGFKNDQVTRLNVRESDLIKNLRKEIEILKNKIEKNKLNDDNRAIDENKPNK